MKPSLPADLPKAKRTYKDSVFRHLLTEYLQRLQEVHHAASGKFLQRIVLPAFDDEAFFSEIRTDVTFTDGQQLVVFDEQQSTWSENLPLRFLWYVARHYRKYVDPKAPYRKTRILLLAPEFYVFYNGKAKMPERFTVRLSDSFLTSSNALDLTATVININYDPSFEIFKKSPTLAGYSQFVAKARELEEAGASLDSAVANAIEWCIRNDILSDYMKTHGRWVREMITFEYDADLAMAAAREDGFAAGEAKGEAKGEARGEGRLSRLMSFLLKNGKSDEAMAATENAQLRQELYRKYGIA